MKNKLLRKILITLWSILISVSAFSQIQVAGAPQTDNINGENLFMDASSSFDDLVDPTSASKGLLFPRVDLTTWSFSLTNVYSGSPMFPGIFDGMIVYNKGEGNTPTTQVSQSTYVTPGFYFFYNPDGADQLGATGDANDAIGGGQWIRLADSKTTTTPKGAAFPTTPAPSAGDVFYRTDILDYYYYNGTKWIGVSNKWMPAKDYVAGNFVEYDGNFYIANTTFTSDASDFAVDAANWNYAGGKDAKYKIAEMQMDNQSLTKVAVNGTTVDPADVNTTIATVGYIQANSNSAFDANKIITRTGLDGITGQNFNTTTVTDFLNKVFFPVLSPVISSFRYNTNTTAGQYSYQTADPETKVVTDHVGTVTIPYSTWNGLGNVVFNYDITKRDGTSAITKVELFKNGVTQGTVVDGAVSGTFSLATAGFTNIDATQNIPMTLTVTDDASNEVSLLFNTSFTQASGVTLSSARISATSGGVALTTSEGTGSLSDPYLIERTGSSFNYFFNWAINPNDDNGAVTDIDFSGTPSLVDLTGANITQTSIAATLPHADASTVYRAGARARGSVANDWSPIVYSQYYQLQDRFYCGYLPSTAAPTEAQIKALQQGTLKTTTYYATNGVTLTNGLPGSGFFTWAVPTYVDGGSPAPAFTRTAYYYATGQWFVNTNVTIHNVQVTAGGTSSWYWVCIYSDSTNSGASVQAKLN